ncbi:MAG: tetratricopeptide repeat protein [Deltaproteobacteria bacterium]|nr:tetratricopeptide repeat protein [Deltaproteobacteria bacterium]
MSTLRRTAARRAALALLGLGLGLLPAGLCAAAPAEAVEAEAPRGPLLLARQVEVLPGDDGQHVVLINYELRCEQACWLNLPLDGALRLESAALDGRPLGWAAGAQGPLLLARLEAGTHLLRARAVVTGAPGALQIELPAAARSTVALQGAGLRATLDQGVPRAGGLRWDQPWGGRVDLRWSTGETAPPRPQAISGEALISLRADEEAVFGRAELSLRVAHAPLARLPVRLPGATRLELLGPDGAPKVGGPVRVSGADGSFVLEFDPPLRGSAALSLAWAAPLPTTAAGPAPVPVFEGARELDGWLSLSQEDGAMIAPEGAAQLEAAPLSARPDRLVNMSAGAPVAAWRVRGPRPALQWSALGGAPLSAPPLIVDAAEYRLAVATHGRLALRATWQVRNDRQQHLRVTLPPGQRPMGARVAGRPVALVQVDARTWLLPLEKSVETFSGLVAFPVELNVIGSGAAWARRGWQELLSPAVDAPVAAARWRIELPAERALREIEGTPRPVRAPTGRLELGHALVREEEEQAAEGERADDAQRQASQESWNLAYSAYKANRFEEADALLKQASALDPSNSAASALQGNVDLLLGRVQIAAEDKEKAKVARKVKAQASSRADADRAAQQEGLKAAEVAVAEGNLDEAVENYRAARDQTWRLAQLEQDEAVEEKARLAELDSRLAALEEERRARSAPPPPAKTTNSSFSTRSASRGPAVAPAPTPPQEQPAAPRFDKNDEQNDLQTDDLEEAPTTEEDLELTLRAGKDRPADGRMGGRGEVGGQRRKEVSDDRKPATLGGFGEGKGAAPAAADGHFGDDDSEPVVDALESSLPEAVQFEGDVLQGYVVEGAAIGLFGVTIEGEAGGVEGGVVGGVVGGVLGGVLGGVASGEASGLDAGVVKGLDAPPPPPPPPPPPRMAADHFDAPMPAAKPLDLGLPTPADPGPAGGAGAGDLAGATTVENTVVTGMESPDPLQALNVVPGVQAEGVVISREFLERVPAGRSYQQAVQVVAGTTDKDAPEELDKKELDRLPVQRDVLAAAQAAPAGGGLRFEQRGPPARRPAPPVVADPNAPWPLDPAPPAPPQRVRAAQAPGRAAATAALPVRPAPPPPATDPAPGLPGRPAAPPAPWIAAPPPHQPPVRPTPSRLSPPLPIPTGVDAVTLTLSMPLAADPLELQQQLVAAGEPLRVRLRVRPRRAR